MHLSILITVFTFRFYATYNRLVQAGTYESFHPLLNTHKFMHVIRTSIGTNSFDVDMLIEIWSGVATPLLDTIEKVRKSTFFT